MGAQNQEKTVFFRDQDENSIPLKQNQSTVGFISDLPENKFSNENDLIVSPKQVFLKGQGPKVAGTMLKTREATKLALAISIPIEI